MDIGEKNIEFILQYIYNENLNLQSQDVGDIHARKIIYDPFNGMVKVKKLRAVSISQILTQEENYLRKITAGEIGGNVELF